MICNRLAQMTSIDPFHYDYQIKSFKLVKQRIAQISHNPLGWLCGVRRDWIFCHDMGSHSSLSGRTLFLYPKFHSGDHE